jgi:hypothetical protein
MRNILIITAALLISLSSCKFIKEKGWFGTSKADTLVAWQAKQDSIRVADSIEVEIEKMKMQEQERLDSLQAIEDARMEWESRFKYHIIVGSFLTPEYANDYLAYYQSMGYNATIVPGPKGRFNLVSAEVHESISEAIRRLAAYQDTVDFESWLYIKN